MLKDNVELVFLNFTDSSRDLERSSIWLTGGRGFIGSHLVAKITERKFSNVTCLISQNISDPVVKRISEHITQVFINFENLKHLIWLSTSPLLIEPNYVLLAGWKNVVHPNLTAHETENVASVVNLFSSIPKSHLKKTIFFGSIDEYGDQFGRIREDEPPISPLSNYAKGKTLASLKLNEIANSFNLEIQHCYISNVYGPGQREVTMLPQMKKSKSFRFGGENYYRDYIFVENLVDIILLLLKSDLSFKVNVGSGVSTHCYDFARTAWRLMNKNPEDLSFSYPEIRDLSQEKFFDLSRMQSLTSSNVEIDSIERGLMKTVAQL